MPVAYVALGSNLGDKKAYLEDALSRMKVHGIKVQKVSTWIQTAPYGVTDQPEFLNGAAEVDMGPGCTEPSYGASCH